MSKFEAQRQHSRPATGRSQRLALAAILLFSLVTACLGGGTLAPAGAIDPPPTVVVLDMQRGQSLYEGQCVTCHTTQAHWRDNSIVGSWGDVLTQVQRWQENTGLHWSASEIGDVAAYLNAIYYKMPCSTLGCQGKSTAALTQGISAAKSRRIVFLSQADASDRNFSSSNAGGRGANRTDLDHGAGAGR